MGASGVAYREELMSSQNAKVKARQEEMKKIQKGIYQMQVMMDSQEMETFKEEWEKSEAKAEGTKNENAEEKQTESSSKENETDSKTDSKTEMEKMMSFGRNLGLGKI